MSDLEYWPETHRQGVLEVTMSALEAARRDDLDFGVQIAPDGRVWVCLNGAAFLRFKPSRRTEAGR